MRTSRIVFATLALAIGIGTFASSVIAKSVVRTDSPDIAAACGLGTASTVPLNLDLIPSKPVVGHQSVRGVGDDEGCGEDAEHDARGSDEGEGSGGDD